MLGGFGSEFVVASTEVLDECVTSNHHRGGAVAFEPSHRSEPGFESAVIALHAIVRILIGVVTCVRDQLLDDRLQRLGQIGDDPVGLAVRDQRTVEEFASSRDVALWRDVDVDDGCRQLGRAGPQRGRRNAISRQLSHTFRRRTTGYRRHGDEVEPRRSASA